MVERYTVDATLGAGGMAVVYRVRHNQLGSLHAMKVLTVPAPTVRARLLQEGRLQGALRHPHVVAVTDVVEVDGCPALIMEYVRGPTLSDLLQAMRPSFAQVDDLAQGVLAGVEAAHRHGLVHRDLKPSNILVSTDSGVPVPKIADFGLAKVLQGEGGGHGPQTRSGVAMGTPAYMAPEQIRDAAGVDSRADVFSVGAILYELVTGHRAFVGKDTLEVFQAVCDGRFVPVQERAPKAPPRVVDAIEAALQVDIEARVADCATLLERWTGRKGAWQADTAWDQQALFRVEALSSAGSPSVATRSGYDETYVLHTRGGALTHTRVAGEGFDALGLSAGSFRLDREGPEVTLTRAFEVGVVPISAGFWEAVAGTVRPELLSWDQAVAFCNAVSVKLGEPEAYTLGAWTPRRPWTADDAGRALYALVPFERIGPVVSRFGADTLRVVQFEPDRLLEVEGIGRRTVERLVAAWNPSRWFTRDVRPTGSTGWRLATEAEWACAVRAMGIDTPDWEWVADADPGPAWAQGPTPLPPGPLHDPAPCDGPRRVLRRAGDRDARAPWEGEGVQLRLARWAG